MLLLGRSLDSATKRSIFGKAKPFAMKYAVLLVALMFVGCKNGYEKGGETIVANGKVIEVAKEDFPEDMEWKDAMSACQKLGSGWRLPSKEELEEMYTQLHKKGKGNFSTDDLYWSNSEDNRRKLYFMWAFDFEIGRSLGLEPSFSRCVRAVRTTEEEVPTEVTASTIVDGYETITIHGKTVQVAQNDIEVAMDWYNAMDICQSLGNGWRLPSKEELMAMCEQLHNKGKGNFYDLSYWSSSQRNPETAFIIDFEKCSENDVMLFKIYKEDYGNQVRAVRDLP